jgi:transcriptional regulator with XRE-family HTH domain
MKKKDFGKRLAQLRKERGMTQDDLAASLRVSRSTIGMYEQGRREPDFEFLDTVADFFDVSIGFLVSGPENRGTYPRHDYSAQSRVAEAEVAYGSTPGESQESLVRRLSAYEENLILAYRKADGSTKRAAERVLGVE